MPSSPTACDGDVDDIEDCVSGGDLPRPSDRIKIENKILPKALRRKLTSDQTHQHAVGDSFIPGTHSIYIKTWGCSHNNSDGEYMAGLLGASGYTITGELFKIYSRYSGNQSVCCVAIRCCRYS